MADEISTSESGFPFEGARSSGLLSTGASRARGARAPLAFDEERYVLRVRTGGRLSIACIECDTLALLNEPTYPDNAFGALVRAAAQHEQEAHGA